MRGEVRVGMRTGKRIEKTHTSNDKIENCISKRRFRHRFAMIIPQLHVETQKIHLPLLVPSISFSDDVVKSIRFSLGDDSVGEIVENLRRRSHLPSILAEDLGELPEGAEFIIVSRNLHGKDGMLT